MECAICSNSLHEAPDLRSFGFATKRVRSVQAESLPGPSSRTFPSTATELCAPRCGHVLHTSCLLTWIYQKCNKTCPICRTTLTQEQLIPIFLPTNVKNKDCRSCKTTKEVIRQVIVENDKLRRLNSHSMQKQNLTDSRKALELRDKEIAELNAKCADKIMQISGLEQSFEHEKSFKIEQIEQTNSLQYQNDTLGMQLHNSKTSMDEMQASYKERRKLYQHAM